VTLTAQKRARVRRRAQQNCEYCRLPQKASVLPHQVDHIVAQQHSGSDQESNLCLCCLRCHLKKGPNIASIDPEATNENNLVDLFHPRKQHWHDNFQLQDDGHIVGYLLKAERQQDFWTSTRKVAWNLGECSCDKVGDHKLACILISLVDLQTDAKNYYLSPPNLASLRLSGRIFRIRGLSTSGINCAGRANCAL